jgi:hypothetical protein
MNTTQQFVGRFARSIESGWLGKVIAVEQHSGETLLRMQGVNELCRIIAGGSLDANLDSDDTQWFAPADVKFLQA